MRRICLTDYLFFTFALLTVSGHTALPHTAAAANYGTTPLHLAVLANDVEETRRLLADNADVNALDNSGKSVLDVTFDPAIISILEKAGAKSVKPDNMALYDELGRPMNKAAAMADARRRNSGNNLEYESEDKNVGILLNTSEEAEILSETIADERKGNPTRYLTRAVLMAVEPKDLAERIKAGAGVNVEDPVFGFALVQAIEQQRGSDVIRCLLDNGADPDKGKPLLKAVRYDDESVTLLLNAGADPMTVDDRVLASDSENTRVLTCAVDAGNKNAVAALLKAGADPEAKNKHGATALYYALWRNKSLEIVRLLLENGASAKSFPALEVLKWHEENIPLAILLLRHGASAAIKKEYGETLVTWAVRDNSLELLEAAIKAKVPVTGFDRYENSPLLQAVLAGNPAMVSALIKAGAPINKSCIKPGQKFGADDLLVRAVRDGNEKVIEILVADGINLDARENSWDRRTALHKSVAKGLPGITAILLEAGAKPDIGDRYKRTPLHTAVLKRDQQFLTLLLAKKANPDVKDMEGHTPLYEAVQDDNALMAETLLKAGANPNLATSESRRTPLHIADNASIAAMLLAAGANPNARADEGKTPLHFAAHRSDAKTVRLLLDAKADCNAKTKDGTTPLLSIWQSDPETIKTLLDAGADPNAKAGYKETALHLAAGSGEAEAVRLLIAAKADPNAKDNDSNETALHRAAESGMAETVMLLLAAKADPNAKGKSGATPLDIANGDDVIKLLEAAGARYTQ